MDTYTQIYIHIVFRVKNVHNILNEQNRTIVYKYIIGIIKNIGHKPIIVNGMADHIHILLGMKPDKNISQTVHEIKRCSTNFINQNKLLANKKFSWQEGYGAFSYSHSQLPAIIKYIKSQKNHHIKRTYKEEYLQILKKYNVQYNEKWLDP